MLPTVAMPEACSSISTSSRSALQIGHVVLEEPPLVEAITTSAVAAGVERAAIITRIA